MTTKRQPKGQSTGGQFAASQNPESTVDLDRSSDELWEVEYSSGRDSARAMALDLEKIEAGIVVYPMTDTLKVIFGDSEIRSVVGTNGREKCFFLTDNGHWEPTIYTPACFSANTIFAQTPVPGPGLDLGKPFLYNGCGCGEDEIVDNGNGPECAYCGKKLQRGDFQQ